MIIYDLSREGFEDWNLIIGTLIFPLIGLAFVQFKAFFNLFLGAKILSWMPRVLLYGGMLLSMTFFVTLYSKYYALKGEYEAGNYKEVEGLITDYQSSATSRDRLESFMVEGIGFKYSEFDLSAGFRNSGNSFQGIRDGACVKISYIGRRIVRISTCDFAPSLPSPE